MWVFSRRSNSRTTPRFKDLTLLRCVRCLIRFGLTLDEAGAVVSGELERFRTGAPGKQRSRLVLVGMRLVPMPV
jgi:hypothetical protein